MKRVTIKVGSTFFIDGNNVNVKNIRLLVEQISILKQNGLDVCLVTSGAIAVGVKKLKLNKRPTLTSKKQALAAIGQMYLMQIYEGVFEEYNLKCAQILLSHDDFGNRDRINNLKATLNELFEYGVVPVINENDAVAVAEIKVGDNDTLSSMVSLAIESSMLILVSDVNGLYTANPSVDKSATLIKKVDKIDDSIINLAKAPDSEFGTGGMLTKIKAAQISVSAGIPMVITNKTEIQNLYKIVNGEEIGTYFTPSNDKLPLKKCWLKYCANVLGSVTLDSGASKAVLNRKSLLSCGIIKVEGVFNSGSVINILNEKGELIAKGVCPFNNSQVKGFIKNKEIKQIVAHADNLVTVK